MQRRDCHRFVLYADVLDIPQISTGNSDKSPSSTPSDSTGWAAFMDPVIARILADARRRLKPRVSRVCMCGKAHPCPDHGQWAHTALRPIDRGRAFNAFTLLREMAEADKETEGPRWGKETG